MRTSHLLLGLSLLFCAFVHCARADDQAHPIIVVTLNLKGEKFTIGEVQQFVGHVSNYENDIEHPTMECEFLNGSGKVVYKRLISDTQTLHTDGRDPNSGAMTGSSSTLRRESVQLAVSADLNPKELVVYRRADEAKKTPRKELARLGVPAAKK